jgi:hypothetical protein
MKNNNDFLTTSKLIINGFTLNPIRNKNDLKNIIKSLCNNYTKDHVCDFDGETIHKNYLKKQVGEIYVEEKIIEEELSYIGFVILENGYFTLTIKKNVFPSEILFDLYLEEKILDFQIIIDHLSCPAKANHVDGLGMFDYAYSLTYNTKHESKLYKDIKENCNYEYYTEDLNSLKNAECYFCSRPPEFFIFYNLPRKTIFVCKNHKNFGTQEEISSKDKEEYVLKEIKINGKIFQKNIKKH